MSWDELSNDEKYGQDRGRAYQRAQDRALMLMGGGRFVPIDYSSPLWQGPGVGRSDSFEGGAGDHEVDGGYGDAGGDAGGDGGGVGV